MISEPLKLIVCIAVGIWLGFIAVAATVLLMSNAMLAGQANAISSAMQKFETTSHMARSAAQPTAENPMFEKYKQNLIDTQAQQNQELTQAEREKRLSGPKCQFWLQQDQNAPSEKSRFNVAQFCG